MRAMLSDRNTRYGAAVAKVGPNLKAELALIEARTILAVTEPAANTATYFPVRLSAWHGYTVSECLSARPAKAALADAITAILPVFDSLEVR